MIKLKQESKTGLKYGVVLGFIVVSIGIIRYKTGMIFNEDQRLSHLYWILFFITNLGVVISYKKFDYDRFLLWRAIKIGMMIGFISSFMYLLYLIVLNYFIDPELPEKLIEASRQKMVGLNKELTPQQIKELEFMKSASNPVVRGSIYIMLCTIFGIISAVIGGIFVKLRGKKL